jgi:uncharacterized protein (DUF2147 family)
MKRTNRFWGPVLGLTLAAALGGAAFAGADDVVGTWKDAEKGSIVKVYSCGGGGVCAQIVKTSDANAKDENNPDPAKRNRPIAGLVFMNGAKKSGENGWKGTLYNREDGQSYSGSLTVLSKDELKLEGCVLGGLICKSRSWTRVK